LWNDKSKTTLFIIYSAAKGGYAFNHILKVEDKRAIYTSLSIAEATQKSMKSCFIFEAEMKRRVIKLKNYGKDIIREAKIFRKCKEIAHYESVF